MSVPHLDKLKSNNPGPIYLSFGFFDITHSLKMCVVQKYKVVVRLHDQLTQMAVNSKSNPFRSSLDFTTSSFSL